MSDMEDIKSYFDKKLSSLKRDLNESRNSHQKKTKKFKYKSNEKQYEFNMEVKEELQEILDLLDSGAKNRPINRVKQVMESIRKRNKMLRIADKYPGGWKTVREYETDSVASDTADERKLRGADRRAMERERKKPYSRYDKRERYNSGRLGDRPKQSTRTPKKTDICLRCGKTGHWKRDCRVKTKENNDDN